MAYITRASTTSDLRHEATIFGAALQCCVGHNKTRLYCQWIRVRSHGADLEPSSRYPERGTSVRGSTEKARHRAQARRLCGKLPGVINSDRYICELKNSRREKFFLSSRYSKS